MENILSKLADIKRRLNNISQEMKRENQVYMQERNERLRLGLTGGRCCAPLQRVDGA